MGNSLRWCAAAGLGVLVVLPPLLGDAGAASSPAANARKCRAAIAGGGRAAAAAGLATIDGCHVRRDKGQFQGDCNVIPSNAEAFARATARAEATIGGRCPSGNPVLANYPNGVDDIFKNLKALIEMSGADVQGSPDIAGDPSSRKARSKCHKAIGKARSGIIKEIVTRATGCQKKLDKKATEFGPLDASCAVSPGASSGKARSGITKGCSGITGPEVGSCATLPDCVVSEATTAGQAMAKAIYQAVASVEATCGDGVVGGDEQCDDGNRIDFDACRNSCKNAVCGDGVVEQGVEECDDGNTIPDDGCTDCKYDGAACGASGVVDVVVELVFDARNLSNLGGGEVNLGYSRAGVSIPGSLGDQSVLDRCQDLTGNNAALFVDKDTNSDGTDDDLYNQYIVNDPTVVAPGPFEQIHFDCSPGAHIRPSEFDCRIDSPFDNTGNCLKPDCSPVVTTVLDCKVTGVTAP